MRGVIADLVSHAATQFGDATAVTIPDGGALSFRAFDDHVGRFAGGLAKLGVGRGDRVILHLPNGLDWIVAYHAIARMGAVVIPANILLSPAELTFIAQDTGAVVAILSPEKAAADVCGAVKVVPQGGEDMVPFNDLFDAEWMASVELAPNDLFTIAYTSGTTGQPKGAMLTHGNIFASVAMTSTIHVRTRYDHVYSALPFPHVYGNVVMNAIFLTGGHLIASPRFDAASALAAIAQNKITLFEGVPTMYYQMLAHTDIADADLSSLTRCTVGGQTMPVAKLQAVADRFGCPVLELWGMTEVGGPATSHSPWWPPHYGSIGLPFPGTEVRIDDPIAPGQAASVGTAGELMIRGPLVTRGYWNNPEATGHVFETDGWMSTGDIAIKDENGYLFIVDRKKDMILTAGYNVYPAELERVIAMHPAVSMVAVAGRSDEEKGEVAEAFVVLHRDATVDAADLTAHCRGHLAAYKIPRSIHFVDDLPKTSTGKIMRRALAPPDPTPERTLRSVP